MVLYLLGTERKTPLGCLPYSQSQKWIEISMRNFVQLFQVSAQTFLFQAAFDCFQQWPSYRLFNSDFRAIEMFALKIYLP